MGERDVSAEELERHREYEEARQKQRELEARGLDGPIPQDDEGDFQSEPEDEIPLRLVQ